MISQTQGQSLRKCMYSQLNRTISKVTRIYRELKRSWHGFNGTKKIKNNWIRKRRPLNRKEQSSQLITLGRTKPKTNWLRLLFTDFGETAPPCVSISISSVTGECFTWHTTAGGKLLSTLWSLRCTRTNFKETTTKDMKQKIERSPHPRHYLQPWAEVHETTSKWARVRAGVCVCGVAKERGKGGLNKGERFLHMTA